MVFYLSPVDFIEFLCILLDFSWNPIGFLVGSYWIPMDSPTCCLLPSCCLLPAVLSTAGEAWEQALSQQECRAYSSRHEFWWLSGSGPASMSCCSQLLQCSGWFTAVFLMALDLCHIPCTLHAPLLLGDCLPAACCSVPKFAPFNGGVNT